MNYQIEVSNLPKNTPDCELKKFFADSGFDDIAIKPERDFIGQKGKTIEFVGWSSEGRSQSDIDKLVKSAIRVVSGKTFRGHEITLRSHDRYSTHRPGQPEPKEPLKETKPSRQP